MNKVEEDYLGVVMLGLFNAAIGFSDIRSDLVYCEADVSSAHCLQRNCIDINLKTWT